MPNTGKGILVLKPYDAAGCEGQVPTSNSDAKEHEGQQTACLPVCMRVHLQIGFEGLGNKCLNFSHGVVSRGPL